MTALVCSSCTKSLGLMMASAGVLSVLVNWPQCLLVALELGNLQGLLAVFLFISLQPVSHVLVKL